MQAAQKQRIGKRSEAKMLVQRVQETYSCYSTTCRPYENGNRGKRFCGENYLSKFCTLDSSSVNGGHSSASTISFSPIKSPISRKDSFSCLLDARCSPENGNASSFSSSCVSDEENKFRNKLRELESMMLGPDSDDSTENFCSGMLLSTTFWLHINDAISRRDLKQVLIAAATAVAEDDHVTAWWLLNELREMVSVCGEPIERLGAYMLEGLVARMSSSGSSIYKSLRCKEPESSDLLSYMNILYGVCPYFKFGYISANGAVAEAMKDEKRVHIIDFQVSQGSQWVTLIQAFAARPSGPPHIRITGMDDSTSAYARGGGLEIVGKRLSKLAQYWNVPFEFHAAPISGYDVQLEHLDVRPGDALAVNFAFVLHHMPDESVSTQNHRDRLLRMIRSLQPKVVTLIEQESNTNTTAFFPRFKETLDYYGAMFESMDVTFPRDHKERIEVEQHCLAKDVVNIVACEGGERVERHELLGKWRSRFAMAGFTPYPLSTIVNGTIRSLLGTYSDKYRIAEKDGALYLGWMNRDLVSSSAWIP
ncbi:hypothetical protein MLD38_003013 [Melastoma candidum]|uniref:Uncharacterized protein n=1 Tax=Melastoma candidum TaxID=119954 RepID=A0ACB9S1C9_9MYRT|nr:hypothetical protein MLD38_003013 [Melastoma candidum]